MENTLKMEKIDSLVFLPQVAGIIVLTLLGVMPLVTFTTTGVIHLLSTIAIVSFLAGLTFVPCTSKNISPLTYRLTIFLATLGIGTFLK